MFTRKFFNKVLTRRYFHGITLKIPKNIYKVENLEDVVKKMQQGIIIYPINENNKIEIRVPKELASTNVSCDIYSLDDIHKNIIISIPISDKETIDKSFMQCMTVGTLSTSIILIFNSINPLLGITSSILCSLYFFASWED